MSHKPLLLSWESYLIGLLALADLHSFCWKRSISLEKPNDQ